MPRGVPKSGVRMTKKRVTEMNLMNTTMVTESRFTINQKFDFVADMVTMVAKQQTASVIICGDGGLGKSHTVSSALKSAGLKDAMTSDVYEVGGASDKNYFTTIKGYSTPKGLYRLLFENKDGVLVMDDTDSVLKDAVSLSLLKSALDSYSRRIISWRADIKDEDLPTSFVFNGRIVFISNMSSAQIDQAILSRSMVVDLSMNRAQKVERMRYLLTQRDFMPEFTMAVKTDAMDLIDRLQDKVKELSLRSLIKTARIRASNNKNWSDLAEYSLVG